MSLRKRLGDLESAHVVPQKPVQRFPKGPTRLELWALEQYIEHMEAGGERDEALEKKFGELANRPVSPKAAAVERQIEALEGIDAGLP